MAVTLAAAPRPVPHGQRSPTLSDAGMILPVFEADAVRGFSPTPYIAERPPSPPALFANPTRLPINLASAPQARRIASKQRKSPALSSRSSRSTLRNMGDPEAAATSAVAPDDALASSPTLQDVMSSDSRSHLDGQGHRRFSSVSSSVHSEDLDNWPGFDSHNSDNFDDSAVDLEEKRDNFLTTAGTPDNMQQERRQSAPNSNSDEDEEMTSAALSRRAEMILANAKKRLNVMEGNLRGARESLVVSPTFNSKNGALDLSQHISAARERDRRLYAGIGPIPPRIHSYRVSQLSPSSPVHSRGLSETSVALPFTPSYMTRSTVNKRASSAIGHTSSPWSAEGYGQGRFPIKESRSVEVLRDPRTTWTTPERDSAARSTSRSSRSPPALETLPEDDDGAKVHRSSSAASGLRDQMNDLKGRMASLKQKAQEDRLRRRSLQSLRTPSPFTSAETWQSGSNGLQSGGSPFTANAGLGVKTENPTGDDIYDAEYAQVLTPKTTASQNEGERLVSSDVQAQDPSANEHAYLGQYRFPPRATQSHEEEAYEEEQYDDETDEADFVSVAGTDVEVGGESIYEDAVYEMPATERHEDRVDAFDYEHFFLHSAMGTYSVEGRRSSTGSDSSSATTRPVTAVQTTEGLSNTEQRISFHQRNPSVDSVSTIASFATAAEEQDDNEEENEQMDQFSEQLLSAQRPVAPRIVTQSSHSSLRSDSAINMRHANGPSPTQTSISRGSSSPGELVSGLQTSKIFTILTEGSRAEPRLALSEEETELIYGLAASMQQLCSNLQSTYGEAYERKEWRRRLDEARKILNGEEELEDDQSF